MHIGAPALEPGLAFSDREYFRVFFGGGGACLKMGPKFSTGPKMTKHPHKKTHQDPPTHKVESCITLTIQSTPFTPSVF